MVTKQIIQTEAVSWMSQQQSNKYGCVVTSPPYNIGMDYQEQTDKVDTPIYREFTRKWIAEALRLSPVVVANYGAKTSSPLTLAHFMMDAAAVGVIQAHIVWAKSITIDGTSTGHFKPVQSKRYLNNTHESVFVITRDGDYCLDRLAVGVPFADKSNISRFGSNSSDVRCRGNVWYVPYSTRKAKKKHPASYPLELAKMMIKITGTLGDVLDPFCGSGTTLEAAEQLGLASVGLDTMLWTE